MLLPVLILFFCQILSVLGHCKTGHFWSTELSKCKECSVCPANHIIRRPCDVYRDTLCTKFFEFENFNLVNDYEKGYHISPDFPRDKTMEPVGKVHDMPTITKDVGQYWKNLAFALIGVLCAMIVLATIIVFLVCRKYQVTSSIKGPEEYDDDADSGYVVIRQIRLAAPQRETTVPLVNYPDPPISGNRALRGQRVPWCYRPKRRLLSDLEYTDEVFESEDSAGSRSSRKMPLSIIHERSDSEGATENV